MAYQRGYTPTAPPVYHQGKSGFQSGPKPLDEIYTRQIRMKPRGKSRDYIGSKFAARGQPQSIKR